MRFVLLLCLGFVCEIALSQEVERVESSMGRLVLKLPSLKKLKVNTKYNPPVTRNLSGLVIQKKWKDDVKDYGSKFERDPVIQRQPKRKPGTQRQQQALEDIRAGSQITGGFEGIGFKNVSPADPTMAVGPNHVLQMINGPQGAYLRIWDKAGNDLVTEKYMFQLFSNPQYFGYGDPIVLYDQFDDRYFITEFGSDSCSGCYSNTLVVGVSAGPDPTGAWYFYKFRPGSFFVDYPHYAAWPDVLYATSNDYNTSATNYLGSSVYAFEKEKMLRGDPTAQMQRFRVRSTQYNKYISMAPVNITGPTGPASENAPGIFAYYHDDNRTSITTDADSVGILELLADFRAPNASVIRFTDQLPVAPFKSRVCNGSRACVPSATGPGYDDLSDRFMNKVYYRNFGTHESIVATHTVDANYPSLPSKAGLRWYEFRRTTNRWEVFQQSTFAPDGDGRWMGAININASGQIALAYNLSGTEKFASIYFTGRNAADPLNEMAYDEERIKDGEAYGTFSSRWGDYNDLVIDPSNDSLFWYTAMYGAVTWKTRISSFKFQKLTQYDSKLLQVLFPEEGFAQCNNSIRPAVSFRNSGMATMQSLQLQLMLDGQLLQEKTFTGEMASRDTAHFTFDAMQVSPGTHSLTIYSALPNNQADEIPQSDTLSVSFTILSPVNEPVSEGFESETFPPAQWRIINEEKGSVTWTRTTNAARSGNASVVMPLFGYTNTKDRDDLLSPVVSMPANADSLILSFDLAYKLYGTSASFADSLEIVVSTDCGENLLSVWKKGGSGLATVQGSATDAFIPVASDWKNIRLDLKPFVGNATEVTAGFRTINSYGQNIYLDNINLHPVIIPARDPYVKKFLSPLTYTCERNLLPRIEVGNGGSDTVRNFRLLVSIDNTIRDTISWTGILTPGSTAVVSDSRMLNWSEGVHLVDAELFTLDGVNDANPANNKAQIETVVFSTVSGPLTEGFEEKRFPPSNWAVSTSTSEFNWSLSGLASTQLANAAWIRNFRNNSGNNREELYSPPVNLGNFDSAYLRFDMANALQLGTAGADTLEVFITSDCGATYRSVYKKWGTALQTLGRAVPEYPIADTTGFVPAGHSDWREELINITAYINQSQPFQVIFRSSGSNVNNTFLDDINLYAVNLPPRLVNNGYLVLPNPFELGFTIRHVSSPSDLKAVQVFSSTGQLIVNRQYSANAPSSIYIDMSSQAIGIYQVKLIYDQKVITERILKKK